MKLYHFTNLRHLGQIQVAGAIKPGDSMVEFRTGYDLNDDVVTVVWLLDTPTLEYSHGLQIHTNGPTLGGVWDKTRVRITVDVPAVRWLDWAPAAGMPTWWRDVMIEAGGGEEAAAQWWVFPAPILRRRWAEVTLDGRVLTEEEATG